jgi:hypothetical protein
MPEQGRNDRCACGSGKKVKRCCGQRKGPGEVQIARAFLNAQRQAAVVHLASHDYEELADLFRMIVELPTRYDELVVDLPRLGHPDLEPLRREIKRDHLREDSPALSQAIAVIDSPVARAHLVRNALSLHDQGDLDLCMTATAVADLTTPDSLLIRASLIQALLIDTGRATRTSGLLVAH